MPACTTSDPSSAASPELQSAQVIEEKTVLPKSFVSDHTKGTKLVIPRGLLSISQVSRPQAELRSGPGADYKLSDTLLPRGAQVIEFDRVGEWQKVVVIDSGESGWVHRRALSTLERGNGSIVILGEHLPLVFAVRPVQKGFEFPSREPLNVAIPKGERFLCIRIAEQKFLIVILSTGSVLWVSKDDFT